MESAHPRKWLEGPDLTKEEQPRLPKDVATLRSKDRRLVTADADRLLDHLDEDYEVNDEVQTTRCVAPKVYIGDRPFEVPLRRLLHWRRAIPLARDSCDLAWQELVYAEENPPRSAARYLRDALETRKRSREYMNGEEIDKFDLDNLFVLLQSSRRD